VPSLPRLEDLGELPHAVGAKLGHRPLSQSDSAASLVRRALPNFSREPRTTTTACSGGSWPPPAAAGARRWDCAGQRRHTAPTATLRTSVGERRKTLVDPDGAQRELRVLIGASLTSDRPRVIRLDPETLQHLQAHRAPDTCAPGSARLSCTADHQVNAVSDEERGSPCARGSRRRDPLRAGGRRHRLAAVASCRRRPRRSRPTRPRAARRPR
jgi:hypothetical protein